MKVSDSKLKCTWTNGLIWGAVTAVGSIAIRCVMLTFVLYSIMYDSTWEQIRMLLLPAALLPVALFLISYVGYMRRAAYRPDDLHGVARSKHWIIWLVILIVLTVIWSLLCIGIVWFMDQMSFYNEYDMECMKKMMLALCAILGTDVILFLIGRAGFKPKPVQGN